MNIEEYLKRIENLKEDVYIFGAGKVGKIIYQLLKEKEIDVQSFLVTDVKQNESRLFEKEVQQANMTDIDKRKPVLIAVLERGEKKIQSYLETLGYTYIIEVPNGILEVDPWEYKRVRTPVIEVTAKVGCAVNCRYCPQELLVSTYFKNNVDRKREMTIEDYKRFIDKCPKDTIVDFSGFVEPFLVADSIKMMEYTYQSGHEMTLYTTLRGLSVEQAKKIVRMPFQFVCLHTPDKDNYANIPMTEEYFKVLDIVIDAKKMNGMPFIDIANCQSDAHPEFIKHVGRRLKVYCEMSDRAGNLDSNDASLTHANKTGNIYCTRTLALNHNVLLPDGSLALCCNDFGLANIIGNLEKQSYDEIMRGEKIRSIKRAMHIDLDTDLICRKCMFADEVDNN